MILLTQGMYLSTVDLFSQIKFNLTDDILRNIVVTVYMVIQ